MTRYLCALMLVLGCFICVGCTEEEKEKAGTAEPPAEKATSVEA